MASARLPDLIKAFSCPSLNLVQSGPNGVGLNPALFDAFFEDNADLAIEARRFGLRVPVPGLIDCPVSRRLIDRIAESDETMREAAALLSGEVEGVSITASILLHLMAHVQALPATSIAALSEPSNHQRRAELASHINHAIDTNSLPSQSIRQMRLVDRRNYSEWPGRIPGSIFFAAWLCSIESRKQPYFVAS